MVRAVQEVRNRSYGFRNMDAMSETRKAAEPVAEVLALETTEITGWRRVGVVVPRWSSWQKQETDHDGRHGQRRSDLEILPKRNAHLMTRALDNDQVRH